MDFAFDDFIAERGVRWDFSLEGNGCDWLGGGRGCFGGGGVCCEPYIEIVLQATTTAVEYDRLTVGKIDAPVDNCGLAGTDIFLSEGAFPH